ncbi:extracellular solute-binding protein [Oscillochloris sp. ZM17-4]|uniref:sugar ABC transporter substrate-binding protein n=1 Tax=Oscillochloris sp. ZM17-4 TaxID=2866714 RepID=UPI00351D60A3
MTTRQHIWHLLVTWLALLSLAGCSAGAASVAGTPAPTAGAGERAKTVLVLWHSWPNPEDRALAALVERYNRSNPAVQIILQAHSVAAITSDLAMAVSEGGGPHMAILKSHTLGGLADSGALMPMGDLIPDAELSQLLPAALGSTQLQTGAEPALYGVPLTFDTLALYYNKANFAAAPPADTTALLAVARGLTDTRSSPPTWGLAINLSLDRTIGYLYAFGGRIFDENRDLVLGLDGRIGAEAWLGWVESLHSDERILASTDGIAVDNAVMTREALMTFDWSHALGAYRELWQENVGVAPLPRLSDGDRAPQPYVQSDAVVLNARIGAPERQAAVDFIRYLISAESQADLLRAGRQPALRSLDLASVEGVDPQLREAALVFRDQAAQGQPMPNSRQANDVVWGALSDMHANVLRGLLDPEQAVSEADSALRERLGLPPTP